MHFRYAFELAYDGTPFHGWQRQPNANSVQETLEKALQRLNSGVALETVGCGRTDTGVHASYYVVHVDMLQEIDTVAWSYKLNKMLPDAIVIFSIQLVSDSFHARFSAVSRKYRYFIHWKKNPFNKNSLLLPHVPDVDRMNSAAELLLGTQDFTSFSKLHTDVKTNICTVSRAEWIENDLGYYFEIEADRFLRNMVRATVGTLLDVGYSRKEIADVGTILEQQDRGEAGMSVPAHALFLVDIVYPQENFLRYVD